MYSPTVIIATLLEASSLILLLIVSPPENVQDETLQDQQTEVLSMGNLGIPYSAAGSEEQCFVVI